MTHHADPSRVVQCKWIEMENETYPSGLKRNLDLVTFMHVEL